MSVSCWPWFVLSFAASLSLCAPAAAESPTRRLRVACVGDSITEGTGLRDPATESYPSVLARLLGERYEVGNFGVSGATLLREGGFPYWNTDAFRRLPEFAPDFIVLMLGTNDTKVRSRQVRDAFADDLRDLLDTLSSLPGNPRILVCLPPPLVGLLRALNQATLTDEILPAIRRVTGEKGIPTVDVFSAFAGREDRIPDGVHPDAEGAAWIARRVRDVLVSLPVEAR